MNCRQSIAPSRPLKVFLSLAAAVVAFCAMPLSSATAQPVRTFLSSLGNDDAACTATAPCRTLARGIDVVADGGDVLILDSGAFGTNLVISKSVSVYAPPGAQSRVRGFGDSAIVINGTDISVSLSGLGVNGTNGGIGIHFAFGKFLSMRDMDVTMTGNGYGVWHGADDGSLSMADSVMRNAEHCFFSSSGSAQAKAYSVIVRTLAENCTNSGFTAQSNSSVAIKNATSGGFAGSTGGCSNAITVLNSTSLMVLDDVVASNCGRGLLANSGANIAVSNSLLTGNVTPGDAYTNSLARTYGNNRIFGNSSSNTLTGFSFFAEN